MYCFGIAFYPLLLFLVIRNTSSYRRVTKKRYVFALFCALFFLGDVNARQAETHGPAIVHCTQGNYEDVKREVLNAILEKIMVVS